MNGYQIAYILFGKKLTMVFSTSVFAISNRLRFTIWMFRVIFFGSVVGGLMFSDIGFNIAQIQSIIFIILFW